MSTIQMYQILIITLLMYYHFFQSSLVTFRLFKIFEITKTNTHVIVSLFVKSVDQNLIYF